MEAEGGERSKFKGKRSKYDYCTDNTLRVSW